MNYGSALAKKRENAATAKLYQFASGTLAEYSTQVS